MKSRKAIAQTIRQKLNFVVHPPLRDQLLAHALQEQEQSWTIQAAPSEPTTRRMIMKISTTRIAIAALIGAGVVTAAAVGVKYHFVERRPEQGYIVQSEDGHSTMNITENHAASPEHAVETAEEIALLKQQGQRELVGVGEIEVNGQLDSRVLMYKYDLSDGRTITMGEGDPEAQAPQTLTGERLDEAGRLFQQAARSARGIESVVTHDGRTFRVPDEGGERKEVSTSERVIQGRTFIFEKYTFTLSDGTQVAWSSGRLPEDRPSRAGDAAITEGPLPKDLQEWAALRKQGKRQLVGVRELSAGGEVDMRVHAYRYQLSDGRTLDMNEGAGGKWFLSAAQRQECTAARKAKSGQDLGTYEEEVLGRTFVFTRQRFVLSDGTELIWSSGNPKDNQ
jgi:hypothetical protein